MRSGGEETMILNRRTATAWANGNRNDVDQPGMCKQKRIFGGCGLKSCFLAVNPPLEAGLSLGAEPEFVAFRFAGVFRGAAAPGSKPARFGGHFTQMYRFSVVLIRVKRGAALSSS